MNVGFYDHRGNGLPFARALQAAGHTITADPGDVLLIDNDVPFAPYSDLYASHERAVLYPHGGGPVTTFDQYGDHPKTVGQFVVGEGQAELLALLGYDRPVMQVGWPWGPVRAMRVTEPRRVLFAPIHSDAGGWMPDAWKEATATVGRRLRSLPGVQVDVRESTGRLDVHAADAYDVVVTYPGTFLTVALAAGIPAVAYGQDIAPDELDPAGQHRPARRWLAWRDMVRFPHDAGTTCGLGAALDAACAGGADLDDWRRRWVGDPTDWPRFVTLFEKAAVEW